MSLTRFLAPLIAAALLVALPAHAQVQGGYPAFPFPLTVGNCIKALNAYQGQDAGAPCGTGSVSAGTINQLAWYAATGNTISGLATGNNGTLITSAGGVPSISSTLPTAVQGNITRTGTLTSGATGAGYTVALGTSTITGILAGANGGTANGFFAVSGPTTSLKTFTFPNASAAVLTDNAVVTGAQGGTGVANTGKTITLGGSLTTSGAFDSTFTMTAGTTVTFPTTGTLATLAGSEALTNKTLNGLTVTSSTGTLTIAALKVLTASNTLTFAGTDGSTLNVGTGGTLGTAAFVATGTSGGTVPLLNGANTASAAWTFTGGASSTPAGAFSAVSTNAVLSLSRTTSLAGTGYLYANSANVFGVTGAADGADIFSVSQSGSVNMLKRTASASAPGAGYGKLEFVCGTNAGSAKLIAYAGTSGTAVTVTDNIGTGVTGC